MENNGDKEDYIKKGKEKYHINKIKGMRNILFFLNYEQIFK